MKLFRFTCYNGISLAIGASAAAMDMHVWQPQFWVFVVGMCALLLARDWAILEESKS